MSTGAKIAIIAAMIMVVIGVAAITAAVVPTIEHSASQLNGPNIKVTDTYAVGLEHCGVFGDNTTSWRLGATLANTGGSGYAYVNFEINGAMVTSNIYYVGAKSSLPISDEVTLNVCQDPSRSTFNIVLVWQRPA